jgi:nicotinamidase-related amidase
MRTLTAADVPVADRLPDPALLVIDMQNDFVRAGAPLEVPEARATIPQIARLVERFRQTNRPVIFTRFLSEQSPGLMWLWSPQCGPELKCCWDGVRRAYDDSDGELGCADTIKELAPRAGESVIDKYGYGSFHGTELDAELKRMGVRSVVVTGTVAQICVEETAREAFHHGYHTTVASDGVSSFDPELKAAMLRNFAMKFGWVADTDSVLGWLEAAEARSTPDAGRVGEAAA